MRLISGMHNPHNHVSELNILTISRSLHALAGALVGVFVPFYLYELGYPLAAIFLYFVVYFATKVIFHYFTIHAVAKIGPKHTLAISYFLQFLYYGLLFSLEAYPVLFYVAPFVAGMYASFILLSVHAEFSHAASKKIGSDLAKYHIFIGLTAALAPLTGGLIASAYGANMIYLFAIFVIVIALLPLFITREPVKNKKLNLRNVDWSRLRNWAIHQVSYNVASTTLVSLWPLFIALFVFRENPYAGVGFVVTIALLIKVIQTYYLGKALDKNGVKDMLEHSAWLGALAHVVRGLMLTPFAAITFNVISELIHNANNMSYADEFYQAMNHKHRLEHLFFIEIFADSAKMLFFVLLFVSTLYITSSYAVLVLGFLISGIAYSVLGLTSKRIKRVV